MSKMILRRIAVVLAVGVSPSVLAVGSNPSSTESDSATKTTLPTSARSATKLELDAIRTQNALAAERAKAAAAVPGASAGPTVPATDARPIDVESTSGRGGGSASGSTRASVTMVAGPAGQLAATVLTARGLVVVRAGDRMPGLGTVRSISVNQVLGENNKQTLSLPFAAEPASSLIQGGAGTPGSVGMPTTGAPFGG